MSVESEYLEKLNTDLAETQASITDKSAQMDVLTAEVAALQTRADDLQTTIEALDEAFPDTVPVITLVTETDDEDAGTGTVRMSFTPAGGIHDGYLVYVGKQSGVGNAVTPEAYDYMFDGGNGTEPVLMSGLALEEELFFIVKTNDDAALVSEAYGAVTLAAEA